MASEFAQSIATRTMVAYAQGVDDDYETAHEQIAVEAEQSLQEVREVLEGLQTSIEDDGTTQTAHWCDPEEGCNAVCARVSTLYQRLLPKS